MDLGYILIKCAYKSFKGIDELKRLRKLKNKFNLEIYIKENDIGNASDKPDYSKKLTVEEVLKMPPDPVKEKISRYNRLKEKVLRQITPFSIDTSYYEQKFNNRLSKYYFNRLLAATDKALSEPLEVLERVLKQDRCDYNTFTAAALAIRYGIDKGIIKVEE